jgi:hypothetical protein
MGTIQNMSPFRRNTAKEDPPPAAPPRPTPDGKGITFPSQAASDHWKRRVANAGLTVRGLEYDQGATYLTLTGPDPERAKEFLRGESVDRQLFYIVVETPDGVWGTDIEGPYLEKLRPWQLETNKAADCEVPAGSFAGSPKGAGLAKHGRVDNFLVWVHCGKCTHTWADGVRYQDKTMTRCPSCRAKNLVDSSNVHVYDIDETPEPTSSLSMPFSQAARAGDEPRREQTARRVKELIMTMYTNRTALTDEEKKLTTDWRYLDSVLSGGEDPPGWLAPSVELRSIGHQLNREGGARLMRETATQADGMTESEGTVLGVMDLFWHGIGAWRG